MDSYTLMILYLLDILTGSFSKCGFFTFPNFVVCVSFFLVFYVRNLWFLLATKPTKHQCHCCIVAHINWKSKNIVHISCLKANRKDCVFFVVSYLFHFTVFYKVCLSFTFHSTHVNLHVAKQYGKKLNYLPMFLS